jgi:mRNA turnover protein 4
MKGVVTLLQSYEVCKKGKPLTPNQANILKLLEIPMAELRVKVDSVWTKPDDFKVLLTKEDSEDEEDEEDDEGVDLVEIDEADMDMDGSDEDDD